MSRPGADATAQAPSLAQILGGKTRQLLDDGGECPMRTARVLRSGRSALQVPEPSCASVRADRVGSSVLSVIRYLKKSCFPYYT